MKQCRKLKKTKQRKPSASASAAVCACVREGRIERKDGNVRIIQKSLAVMALKQ
jgi:hypothetical protein